jgi:hypothetical protein
MKRASNQSKRGISTLGVSVKLKHEAYMLLRRLAMEDRRTIVATMELLLEAEALRRKDGKP